MKIAIFENEYISIKIAFETANLVNFNSQLNLVVFESSQKAKLEDILDYDVIFIDIDLSHKSELDGFKLIEKLKELDLEVLNKIVIITGNNQIEKTIKDRDLNLAQIQVIKKPTDYEELSNMIKKITL